MCRIFCSPSSTTFEREALFDFFLELEKLGGRDGNGIYGYADNKVWKKVKGMPIEANIDGGILFHTRFGTNGLAKIYNVQPLITERYILVHNGVFSGIDDFARLVGFPFSDKKYSDSYMMSYVLEKVGILNFYNGLREEYYGVIVIYDKTTKRNYLLKTGGVFTCARLESNNKYIYGSTLLDYWKLEDEPLNFGKGLYILGIDEIKKLDTIKPYYNTYTPYPRQVFTTPTSASSTTTQSSTPYNNWKGRKIKLRGSDGTADDNDIIYEDENGDEVCAFCGDKFTQFSSYNTYYGSHLCDDCYEHYADYDETEETEPVGIGALFNDMPKECNKCKWNFENSCWYDSKEHEEPVLIIDEYGNINCNTFTTTEEKNLHCDNCNKPLKINDEWSIVDRVLLCDTCKKYLETWDKSCDDCVYKISDSSKPPCKTCWEGNLPRNFVQIKVDIFDEKEEFEKFYTEGLKCTICGIHFDDGDNYVELEGEILCDDCEEWSFIPYENIPDEARKVYSLAEEIFQRKLAYGRLYNE